MGGQQKWTSVGCGVGAVLLVSAFALDGVACRPSRSNSLVDAGGAGDGTGATPQADGAEPPDGVPCSIPCATGQPCTKFAVAQHLNAVAGTAQSVVFFAAVDLNGDGATDVLGYQQAAVGWAWFVVFGRLGMGLSDELVPAAELGSESSYPTILSDLDRDGRIDLATLATNDGGTLEGVIQAGRGDGRFDPAIALFTPPAGAFALAAADFDGDHWLDLAVVYGQGYPRAAVFLRRADGHFEQQPEVDLASGPPGGLYATDLDGDGLPDLAYAAYSGAVVLRGDGRGALSPLTNLPGPGSPNLVSAGDFDHDGRLDVMVCSVKYGQCLPAFARADGSFQAGSQRSLVLASGDLDGDGFVDIIDFDGIQLSQPGGGFVTAQSFNRAYLGLRPSFAIGDFAGDGQMQAVASTGDVWRLGCH